MDETKFIFIELPKFRKSKKDMKDKLQQWLIVIDGKDKDGIQMAKSSNRLVDSALQTVEYLT